MTSTPQVPRKYLAQCKNCPMKLTDSMEKIGGDPDCPHVLERIVVYPTTVEIEYIEMLNQNLSETATHIVAFETDLMQLKKNKATAENDIKQHFSRLMVNLSRRQEQLSSQMNEAFEERFQAMKNATCALQTHKQKNEVTKTTIDHLLSDGRSTTERKNKISSACIANVKDTPTLKYIPTELNVKFLSLSNVEVQHSMFGKLHTKHVGAGQRCEFPSYSMNPEKKTPAGPQTITVPDFAVTKLRGGYANGITFSFKLPKHSTNGNLNNMNNDDDDEKIDHDVRSMLNIEYECVEKYENQDVQDRDWEQPKFKEIVSIKKCQTENQNQTIKYSYTIDHAFTGNREVNVRIRLRFDSPDVKKYKSAVGAWIPKPLMQITPKAFIYNCELNGLTASFELTSEEVDNFSLQQFQEKFLAAVEYTLQSNEMLKLSAVSLVNANQRMKLGRSSDLEQITNEKCKIIGQISNTNVFVASPEAQKPQFMFANANEQPGQAKVEAGEMSHSPQPPLANNVEPAGINGNNNNNRPEVVPEPVIPVADMPKKMIFVATYKGRNKKVLLKRKVGYSFNNLVQSAVAKFNAENLTNVSKFELSDGTVIGGDADVQKLHNFDAPKKLVQCTIFD